MSLENFFVEFENMFKLSESYDEKKSDALHVLLTKYPQKDLGMVNTLPPKAVKS